MEINCGSVELIAPQQSPLMSAGGEAGLAALLMVILVKAQLFRLTKECMKLLTYQPKARGDNCASFPNNAVDVNDNDDEDEEGKEGEEDENKDESKDRNPNDNKSDPVKGHNRATAGRAQKNGEAEDDEQGDANEDEDDEQGDANEDEDGEDEDEEEEDEAEDEDEDEDGEDGSEGVGEEEDEEEEEEEIQPPKKRKK